MDSAKQKLNIDDYLFCTASFEERCLKGIQKLITSGYKTKRGIIFLYNSPNLKDLRDKNIKLLDEIVNKISIYKSELIDCDIYEPHSGIKDLEQISVAYGLFSNITNCSIDSSTFTKKHLLLLMKYLDNKNCLINNVLYTRTKRDIFTNLTEGVNTVKTVPGFAGKIAMYKPTVLMMALGFESDRAMAIWNDIEPCMTIAIVGSFRDNPKWENKLKKVNSDLLNRDTVRTIIEDCSNPNKTIELIINEYNNIKSQYNLCIAPLGTKAQTLGIYEAVALNPEIQIFYSCPDKYLENYAKRGAGNTLIFKRHKSEDQKGFNYKLLSS